MKSKDKSKDKNKSKNKTARVYRRKNSRVKKELGFKTPSKPKLA